ncbi:MAG: FKBP-type peptidyl-prolyl cis-trans isomerase [Candidatus Thermoplasmatota archaeon]|nr:FKBP-type peptidyl-prolyl cis-trans isomerase [Candidatus Thermoplasmatota archaeon]
MQKEKLAAISLVVIVVVVISLFFTVTYYPKLIENLFEGEKSIGYGDYADLHYIGRYANNNTIFDTSYAFAENKSGGTPLKIFVTLNTSAIPSENFSGYSNQIDNIYIAGFLEGLIGLKEGESKTIGSIPPEKAFGVRPQVGDELDLVAFGGVVYKIVDIKRNTTPLPEWVELGFDANATIAIYTLRDQSHFIGESIDLYPAWNNASKVTKINNTLIWIETTPPEDIPENFTWTELNQTLAGNIRFPANKSTITNRNQTTIVITHSPVVGDNISFLSSFGQVVNFSVVSVTNTIINASYDNAGQFIYFEFNRTTTVELNQTQDITIPIPEETLEPVLPFLWSSDNNFRLSLHPLADTEVIFDVEVLEIYKAS